MQLTDLAAHVASCMRTRALSSLAEAERSLNNCAIQPQSIGAWNYSSLSLNTMYIIIATKLRHNVCFKYRRGTKACVMSVTSVLVLHCLAFKT